MPLDQTDINSAIDKLPQVWITKVRTTREGIRQESQINFCEDNCLIGIGWGEETQVTGAHLESVLNAVRENKNPGWGKRAAQTIERFALQASVGDYVWTRDHEGAYRLCQIQGEYFFENDSKNINVDLHQLRDVEWCKIGGEATVSELTAPGAVVRAFTGQRLAFSRCHDTAARLLTQKYWLDHKGESTDSLPALSRNDIIEHVLDPNDLENLIYIYMQSELDYMVMPRDRRPDTPAYEWMMISRDTGNKAMVQVKSGDAGSKENVTALANAAREIKADAYWFSTKCSEEVKKACFDRNVSTISIGDVLTFVEQKNAVLPERLQKLFSLASDNTVSSPIDVAERVMSEDSSVLSRLAK